MNVAAETDVSPRNSGPITSREIVIAAVCASVCGGTLLGVLAHRSFDITGIVAGTAIFAIWLAFATWSIKTEGRSKLAVLHTGVEETKESNRTAVSLAESPAESGGQQVDRPTITAAELRAQAARAMNVMGWLSSKPQDHDVQCARCGEFQRFHRTTSRELLLCGRCSNQIDLTKGGIVHEVVPGLSVPKLDDPREC